MERKRSWPVVLAHLLWLEGVYLLLPCRSGEATAQLQQLVLRDRVHAVTRGVVEEGRRETMAVLKELEGRVRCPGGGQEVGGLVNFTASREA